MNGEVTLTYSEAAGTQIIQHQDSLTDYCSVSSDCSLEVLGSECSSPAGSASVGSSRAALSADHRDLDQQESTRPETELEPEDSVNVTLPRLQAVTVLLVNDTLWIPRYKYYILYCLYCIWTWQTGRRTT